MQHDGVSPRELARLGEPLPAVAALASLVNAGLRIAAGASRGGIALPLPGADIRSVASAGRYIQRMLCVLDPRELRG